MPDAKNIETNSENPMQPADGQDLEAKQDNVVAGSTNKELNARLALNIIGEGINPAVNIIKDNEFIDVEVKEAYQNLGESINKWQTDIVSKQDENINKTNNKEIHENIKKVVDAVNKQANLDKDAANNALLTIAKDKPPIVTAEKLIKRFEDSKADKDSALNQTTHHRAQVVSEYKKYIEKNPIEPEKRKGWEKPGNRDGEPVYDKDKKEFKMVCRSENDGRLLARKLAEQSNYNPHDEFYINLDPFTKKDGSTFFMLEAGVGFMQEHRRYGAMGTLRLQGKDITFSDFVNSKEHNAVIKYNNSGLMGNITDKSSLYNQGPHSRNVAVKLAGELAINEARTRAIANNPKLDLTNLAAVNLATYAELENVINEQVTANEDNKNSMFYNSNRFSNTNDIKEKVLSAAQDSIKMNMSTSELDLLADAKIANKQSGDEITFKNGTPLTGDVDSDGKLVQMKSEPVLRFDANDSKIFDKTQAMAAQELKEYEDPLGMGYTIKLPNTYGGIGKEIVKSPYKLPILIIGKSLQTVKVGIKTVGAGVGGIIGLGQKMGQGMANIVRYFSGEELKHDANVYESIASGYKKMGALGLDAGAKFGTDRRKSLENWVGNKASGLGLVSGLLSVGPGIYHNLSSLIYHSMPAIFNRSIKHKVQDMIYETKPGFFSEGTLKDPLLSPSELAQQIAADSSINLDNANVRHLVRAAIGEQYVQAANEKVSTKAIDTHKTKFSEGILEVKDENGEIISGRPKTNGELGQALCTSIKEMSKDLYIDNKNIEDIQNRQQVLTGLVGEEPIPKEKTQQKSTWTGPFNNFFNRITSAIGITNSESEKNIEKLSDAKGVLKLYEVKTNLPDKNANADDKANHEGLKNFRQNLNEAFVAVKGVKEADKKGNIISSKQLNRTELIACYRKALENIYKESIGLDPSDSNKKLTDAQSKNFNAIADKALAGLDERVPARFHNKQERGFDLKMGTARLPEIGGYKVSEAYMNETISENLINLNSDLNQEFKHERETIQTKVEVETSKVLNAYNVDEADLMNPAKQNNEIPKLEEGEKNMGKLITDTKDEQQLWKDEKKLERNLWKLTSEKTEVIKTAREIRKDAAEINTAKNEGTLLASNALGETNNITRAAEITKDNVDNMNVNTQENTAVAGMNYSPNH